MPPFGLAELHGSTNIFGGNNDGCFDNGFPHFPEFPAGPVGGVVHNEFTAVFGNYAVVHGRRGGNEVQVEFALESVTGDFHVQKSQESASEPKPEGDGGFGFEGERGVVKL